MATEKKAKKKYLGHTGPKPPRNPNDLAEGWPVKATGSLSPIQGRCGAKLRFTGTRPDNPTKYCKKFPKKGRTRCERCGGGSPVGPETHSWKHGHYSVLTPLPAKLAADYERLLEDEQLLSLKSEIALQRTFSHDLLRRTEDGTIASKTLIDVVRRIASAWQTLATAPKSKKPDALNALGRLIVTLGPLLSGAEFDEATRKELRETWLVLEKLTKAENQRVESLYNMITAERAFALRTAETTIFLEALERHVPDKSARDAVRREVSSRFVDLAARRNGAALGTGGGSGGDEADDSSTDERRGAEGAPLADPRPPVS